jgi:diguanylate cyclase (GGDEF)-like protein
VLFIDLDNFKDANDGFGHHVGDELLIAVSQRLARQLRVGDVLARLGGDEFAIVLNDLMGNDDAKVTAERLLAALDEPVCLGNIALSAWASMGLAYADADTTAPDLLRNADLAMYEAKRNGGSRVAEYQPTLHSAALRRTELEAELRVALERDEFELHYQPIIDLSSQRMIGTEALIRWHHPIRGMVPPLGFIPAAEQSGLIVAIGSWVIRTACAQTAIWQQHSPDSAPLTIAVNLSPRQLLDRTLVATVAEALHDSGLDPSSLCLEITEGAVIKDYETTVPTLNALRKLGVSLALDDFGTGYSSLSYLKQLPVDSVKIDRSFVADIETDNPNAQIVLAIIELAHALGMSVTAEGTETAGQLDTLRAMRSDHAQGFLLGRPMTEMALTHLLEGEAVKVGNLPVQRPGTPGGAPAGI